MNAAAARKNVELALANRIGDVFERREQHPAERLPTGVDEIDRLLHGFPRGAITEIHGAASSGRTSLLLSTLAFATKQEECCALIDCSDTFDLSSAAKAGVDFNRLLWIRCSNNLERSFKAADLLLHGGGFGLVVLNLSDVPEKMARRIISSWWFRFRLAIENTPTALMVITSVACVRSCAAIVLELKNEAPVWSSTLALVSGNGNSACTGKRTQSTPHLSLVAAATPQVGTSSITHSHFLHELNIRVTTERPLEWSGTTVNVRPRLAMFGDIR